MKAFLRRLLIGSIIFCMIFGAGATQTFAKDRKYPEEWVRHQLGEMGIGAVASRLDWDNLDHAYVLIEDGSTDPAHDPYTNFTPAYQDISIFEEQIFANFNIKGDGQGVYYATFGGDRKSAEGNIHVTVIGTERVVKVYQHQSDIYVFHHDSATGVFEKMELNPYGKTGESVPWRCYYAKDKVKPYKAPETDQENTYKVIPATVLTPETWEITVPFITNDKAPMFGGTAKLYDWDDNEVTSSRYEAGADGVRFSGTDFYRIIPGYTYYVKTIPDKGIDCDAEGYVYESVGTEGEKNRFTLGCQGSDYVDSDYVIKGFEINYGYNEDSSGYEPAYKWNGKIEEDKSLLIKPLETVSDWILKARDTGEATASVTVDSYDPGAHVAIDNSASTAVSHITKKSDSVSMGCTDGTLLARSADKEYLAIRFDPELKQVLSASAINKTQDSVRFQFTAAKAGSEDKLEVPAIATLRDTVGREFIKELPAGASEVEFTGLEESQRYILSLKIDDSEEYMPEGCNGIISSKGGSRILYAVELDTPVEVATPAERVAGVTESVLPKGNIHITNSSAYKIRYVIAENDKWKEGDPYVSTGTVEQGRQYTDTKIVKQDTSKTYFIFYKYDDDEHGVKTDYTTGKQMDVAGLLTLKAEWKIDISGLNESSGNGRYIRDALNNSARIVIVETKAEYKDVIPEIYVIEESKYTTDEALMVPANKVGLSTEFAPGTYIAIVGFNMPDEEAAEKGYKVIRKSEKSKFRVYEGKVEGIKVSVSYNGNIRINNPNNIKIEYKIVTSPSWKDGEPAKSGGTVDGKKEHTDPNITKSDKGDTYYVFYRYNDTEKNIISNQWTKHPGEVYVSDLKTIRANWKTDISGLFDTYSEDEISLRTKLLTAGEARIAETWDEYTETGVSLYAVKEKDYTTDEALMAEANKITDATNLDAGTYVAIVGLDITEEEAAEKGYRLVRKTDTKKFTVNPAKLTLVITPNVKTVWNSTQGISKTGWAVGAVGEDGGLDLDVARDSYKLLYSNNDASGEITDKPINFSEEAEYKLSISPVDTGFVIKRGDKTLNIENYEIENSATAMLYVSRIDDSSYLEARKNEYTDKLYYDDLQDFVVNDQLKTYLDAYLNADRKLGKNDYKLVVDHSETGKIADLDPKYKKVGASFDVSIHPTVDGLPLKEGKNTITLTVKKQPIIITAAEPDKLHHFVGDNPVSKYSGTISVTKKNIYDQTGADITFRFGSSVAKWAAADAVSVDLGYIDTNRPGKYNIELKDITNTGSSISLNAVADESYSLIKAGGEYTIEKGLTVSLYDVATGKEIADKQIVPAGNGDIIFKTTAKGEATAYTEWYIRNWDGEGEKLSWPHALGFEMESYKNTGLKIKRTGESATSLSGKLDVYGRFPSDRSKSGGENEFYASDINPVVYNGNKFVAECDTKFLKGNGEVKKGYTSQLDIAVYYGGDALEYGTDYTLSYKNNTNAAKADAGKKAPTVIIKGKGAYKGKKITKTFTILPADLSLLANLKLSNEYVRYNGKEIGKIVKGNVIYSVGSKQGKKLAQKSYAFKVYDFSGKEVTNTVMPKTSEYGAYKVVAAATGKDPNFTGETEEAGINALPAAAKGKIKIKGVKKTVNYTADGVGYADFLDAAKFQVTAGKTQIKDIKDPRITIDIVSEPNENAFAIEKLTNSGSYYLRVKPSQFNTFESENVFEPGYAKINFKGTSVKNLVKLKTKKFTWDGAYHSLDLKVSNKVKNAKDILIYRKPLEKDNLGTKQETYLGSLSDFADKGVIPGGALENSDAGTYVLRIVGIGSCNGEASLSYTVNSTKYSKKAVTAYINTDKKQEDMALDFNRAGYSDELVKVYWKDPSNKDAEPVLLTLNKDYDLIWGRSDKVGKNKGSVTVVGKNTYFSKSFKKTFTINKTDISNVIYDRSFSSALLGSNKANPYLYQKEAFSNDLTPLTAPLVENTDYKITNIVENAGSQTATATIDASGSKCYTGTLNITYDLYPAEVTGVSLTLDRSTVLLNDDYVINSSTDVFGHRYLDSFVEGNIKVTKAEITFKDKPALTLSGDEIDNNFLIGYVNADKTGSNARVMVVFKDGKKYPTSQVYLSDEYTVMVKQ